MRLRTLILMGAGALALALGGCGLRGDLERPAPMWGAAADADVDVNEEAPEDPNAPIPINPPDR